MTSNNNINFNLQLLPKIKKLKQILQYKAPYLRDDLQLALSYFPKTPRFKYFHSLYVSQPSSRWIGVVPYK